MESRRKQIVVRQPEIYSFASSDSDADAQNRLNAILAANFEISRENKLFRTPGERLEAAQMDKPISTVKAFSYFGLLLGTYPPAAIFLKFLLAGGNFELGVLLVFINLICALVGYFSGKFVGKMATQAETRSWHSMLVALSFAGILWGLITGGAGGFVIFGVGALFGAFLAAIIGGAAIPVFAVFHRLLKKGEMIELQHFLPLAFGIVFAISAFILGL